MLKAAIIGCGNIGKGHAKAYKDCRRIELAAVVDIVSNCAIDLHKEHAVPCYAHLEEVLKLDEIDVIDVCLPSGMHADAAIAAAGAGKHCICEKPLDVTPQRCDEMIRAFEQSGTVLGGIYQHRYHDDTQKLKKAIDDGRLGRLTALSAMTPWWRTQAYYDSGDWRGTLELDGGGALMNQSIHAIDLMAWFGGPIKAITAYTDLLAHERVEIEDAAVAIVRFESGALGTIMGTTAANPGSSVRHGIMGTGGTVFLKDDKIEEWKLVDEEETEDAETEQPAEGEEYESAAPDPTQLADNPFSRNIDDIALAIEEGGQPLVTGFEARRAVEIICAIYESQRTGKEIEIPLGAFCPPEDE